MTKFEHWMMYTLPNRITENQAILLCLAGLVVFTIVGMITYW